MRNLSQKILSFVLFVSITWVLSSCGSDLNKKEEVKNRPAVNVMNILKSWDPSRCDELWEDDKIKNCVNNVYYDQAISKKDAWYCEKINNSDSSKSCKIHVYYNKALTDNNKEVCNSIDDKTLQNDCKNNLVISKALKDKDEKSCNDFTWDKNICTDQINMNLARENKDVSYCEKIITKPKKDDCKMEIASYTKLPNTQSWIQVVTNSTWWVIPLKNK